MADPGDPCHNDEPLAEEQHNGEAPRKGDTFTRPRGSGA